MTTSEKITYTKVLADDMTLADETVKVYLDIAENSILSRRFPSGVPEMANPLGQYEMLQCRLASRYILRRGGEGETGHSENGISRTYGSVNDSDLLDEVLQVIL